MDQHPTSPSIPLSGKAPAPNRGIIPSDCETMLWVLEREWMTLDALRHALDQWKPKQTPLGELACRRRLMSMSQVFAVLEDQAETGELFGVIAIRRGYLTTDTVAELLREQSQAKPFLHTYLRDSGRLSAEEWRILEQRIAQSTEVAQSA